MCLQISAGQWGALMALTWGLQNGESFGCRKYGVQRLDSKVCDNADSMVD
jgi:hypothetical protein